MGNYSDPPGISICIYQLNKHGKPKKDLLGLYLYHSINRTNLIELHHKTLISIYGTWKIGIEFLDCVLIE